MTATIITLEKPVYSEREMLELCQMLVRTQIREERINSIEELHGFDRHLTELLATSVKGPGK